MKPLSFATAAGVLSLLSGMPLLAAAPQDFSAALDELRAGSPVPGLVAAVAIGGEVLGQGASGMRRHGGSEAVEVEDPFHLGSCTKSMTATLAAILVNRGTIAWDTSLAEVWPDWELHPGYADVTLEQLLAHRGGLPANARGGRWAEARRQEGTPGEQRARLLRGVLAEPPVFSPGSDHLYSNLGYAAAGAMLEARTGVPWERLLADELFAPLGLNSAGFGPPASEGQADAPWGHVRRLWMTVPVPPGPDADNPPAIAPAGAVHLSIGDFARYGSLHAGALEHPSLASDELAFLHRPRTGEPDSYGLGWIVAERAWAGGRTLHHGGSNTTFFAVAWIAPERDLVLVAAANMGGEAAFRLCDAAIGWMLQNFVLEGAGD